MATNIGMMDSAYFLGRNEILSWINDRLHLNLSRIEELPLTLLMLLRDRFRSVVVVPALDADVVAALTVDVVLALTADVVPALTADVVVLVVLAVDVVPALTASAALPAPRVWFPDMRHQVSRATLRRNNYYLPS